jgi:hypothetical protein
VLAHQIDDATRPSEAVVNPGASAHPLLRWRGDGRAAAQPRLGRRLGRWLGLESSMAWMGVVIDNHPCCLD